MIYSIINNNKDRWIVLIHCMCGNEHVFDLQMNFLREKYNIILIKLEGHGIERNVENATMLNVVKEIHTYVVDNKILKIDILGISLGAMIANLYVEIYPETVENVYLIGMIYGFSCYFFKLMYCILIKLKKVISRRLYMFLITYIILLGKMNKLQRKRMYKVSQNMNIIYLYSWMEEMNCFMKEAYNHITNISNSNANVMYIYGEYDKTFLSYTKKKVPNIKLKVLRKSGHLCNITNASEFNLLIKEEKI